MQSPYVLSSDVFNCRRICLAKTRKATPWRRRKAPVMAISSDAHSCIQLLVTDTWCHHWEKDGSISWSPVNNINFTVISLIICLCVCVYLITSLMCNTDCTTLRLFILEYQRGWNQNVEMWEGTFLSHVIKHAHIPEWQPFGWPRNGTTREELSYYSVCMLCWNSQLTSCIISELVPCYCSSQLPMLHENLF